MKFKKKGIKIILALLWTVCYSWCDNWITNLFCKLTI